MKRKFLLLRNFDNKKSRERETLHKEVVSVFLYKEKATLSVHESVIVGYIL